MAGKTMVLTLEELEAIRDEASESARRTDERFSTEEMKSIREQYEERLAGEQQKREDLEWRLRMAITRLRDVEGATEKLRAVQDSLKGILGEVEERVAPAAPARRVSPPVFRKDFKRAIA
jgi:hypothetical protein